MAESQDVAWFVGMSCNSELRHGEVGGRRVAHINSSAGGASSSVNATLPSSFFYAVPSHNMPNPRHASTWPWQRGKRCVDRWLRGAGRKRRTVPGMSAVKPPLWHPPLPLLLRPIQRLWPRTKLSMIPARAVLSIRQATLARALNRYLSSTQRVTVEVFLIHDSRRHTWTTTQLPGRSLWLLFPNLQERRAQQSPPRLSVSVCVLWFTTLTMLTWVCVFEGFGNKQ